jgi:hypothetical protein
MKEAVGIEVNVNRSLRWRKALLPGGLLTAPPQALLVVLKSFSSCLVAELGDSWHGVLDFYEWCRYLLVPPGIRSKLNIMLRGRDSIAR